MVQPVLVSMNDNSSSRCARGSDLCYVTAHCRIFIDQPKSVLNTAEHIMFKTLFSVCVNVVPMNIKPNYGNAMISDYSSEAKAYA